MTWRWQPPVLSPVSSRGLVDGLSAAIGFRPSHHQSVIGTLRQRYFARDVLLTDSGTSALIIALRKSLPANGTVALPGYGCIDLTSVALGAGLRVRLYDVDPATLSPDLDSVRSVVARGVGAIVVAHFYGYPADVPGVQEIASAHGIPVVEDAAQSAGGTLRGDPLGSFGDLAVLSFGRGKGTTGGSGGALLARTPDLAAWITRTRAELGSASSGGVEVVTLAAQALLGHPFVYRVPASIPALKLGAMVYRPPTPPKPMAAAAAAILESALKLDEAAVGSRRGQARTMLSRIAKSEGIDPVHPIVGGESGYLRLAVLDQSGRRSPSAAIGALRGYPMTLDQHPELRPLLLPNERAGKGSQILRDRLFTLPTHSRVNYTDLARLEEWSR